MKPIIVIENLKFINIDFIKFFIKSNSKRLYSGICVFIPCIPFGFLHISSSYIDLPSTSLHFHFVSLQTIQFSFCLFLNHLTLFHFYSLLIKYSLFCYLFPFLSHCVFRTLPISLPKINSLTSLSFHCFFPTRRNLILSLPSFPRYRFLCFYLFQCIPLQVFTCVPPYKASPFISINIFHIFQFRLETFPLSSLYSLPLVSYF